MSCPQYVIHCTLRAVFPVHNMWYTVHCVLYVLSTICDTLYIACCMSCPQYVIHRTLRAVCPVHTVQPRIFLLLKFCVPLALSLLTLSTIMNTLSFITVSSVLQFYRKRILYQLCTVHWRTVSTVYRALANCINCVPCTGELYQLCTVHWRTLPPS